MSVYLLSYCHNCCDMGQATLRGVFATKADAERRAKKLYGGVGVRKNRKAVILFEMDALPVKGDRLLLEPTADHPVVDKIKWRNIIVEVTRVVTTDDQGRLEWNPASKIEEGLFEQVGDLLSTTDDE